MKTFLGIHFISETILFDLSLIDVFMSSLFSLHLLFILLFTFLFNYIFILVLTFLFTFKFSCTMLNHHVTIKPLVWHSK